MSRLAKRPSLRLSRSIRSATLDVALESQWLLTNGAANRERVRVFVVAQGVDGGKVPFRQGTHGGKRRTPKTGELEKVPETRGLNARRPMRMHRPSVFTGGQSLFATVRKGSPSRRGFKRLA